MKLTVKQLRNIIKEEVEAAAGRNQFQVGDIVSYTGLWGDLDLGKVEKVTGDEVVVRSTRESTFKRKPSELTPAPERAEEFEEKAARYGAGATKAYAGTRYHGV